MLNGLVGIVVYASNGRIEPREYDLKEYWTWKGSGRPPWFVRAIKNRVHRHSATNDAETPDESDYHPEDDHDRTFLESHAGSSAKRDSAAVFSEHPITPPTSQDHSGH